MKDFVKIFVVLCAVVGAFFFGRNFGEESTNESTEIKTLKSENFQNRNSQVELENLKEKFQKLLDSSDLKKSNEILGQIMTIFLADLSLRLTDQQQKDFNEGRMKCSAVQVQCPKIMKEEMVDTTNVSEKKEVETKIAPVINMAKFQSTETEILNSSDTDQMKELLKQLQVKKIDNLLDKALMATFAQSKKFVGTYRGSIIDVTNNVYGTLVMDIEIGSVEENLLKGTIKTYKGGKLTGTTRFESNSIGYLGNSSQSTVISIGGDFLQVYKIESTQKIAGIYYERLPNGTSKTIGTFVLSRTDFVD